MFEMARCRLDSLIINSTRCLGCVTRCVLLSTRCVNRTTRCAASCCDLPPLVLSHLVQVMRLRFPQSDGLGLHLGCLGQGQCLHIGQVQGLLSLQVPPTNIPGARHLENSSLEFSSTEPVGFLPISMASLKCLARTDL